MKTCYYILIRGQAMRPTKGAPYEFETYQEAFDMVSICYGKESLKKDIEIKEINEE